MQTEPGTWHGRRAAAIGVVCASLLLATPLAAAQTPSPASARPQATATHHLTPAQWREDLHVLVGQIQKIHPHPFHQVAQPQFEEAVSKLDADIPGLSDHQVEVRLAQLVAMLGEGHSRLSLPGLADPMSDVPDITPAKGPSLAFHRLPIDLRLFSDGLFVVGATPPYRVLIGSQVTRIGDRSAQAALDAVQPVINRDNDMGARLIGPDMVAIPEVLYALRLTGEEGRTPIGLRASDGRVSEVILPPVASGDAQAWAHADDAAHRSGSPRARHTADNLWTEFDAANGTLTAGVNVIQDAPGQSVAAYAARLQVMAAAHPVKRFVLDLRDCHGGDNSKFRALLLAIVRTPVINQPGRTFVLINRATFSAAVNSASDMERLSNAIFVGEPTAGAPSSWGDPRKVVLPNSGLIARISSVYWRDWTPNEHRPSIAPDIAVAETSADYFAGKDPVMAAVLGFPPRTAFADVLVNLVDAGAGSSSIVRLYYQHKTDPAWAAESTEAAVRGAGAAFLARKAWDDAFLMFAVNARDYPASLPLAAEMVAAAAKADPNNEDLKRLAGKLEAMKPRA
jgi:hypothetical protein